MRRPVAIPGVFKHPQRVRTTRSAVSGSGRRLRSVAGRIREEDIAEVREKARIDEVVSSYVTLRNAGGGNLKGLCPFHDEKSPSFNVTPSRGMYYCFGCGAGGDVIKFVMETDGLAFSETVERLAEKYGVQLRYEEGGPQRPRSGPQRPRLVEAHKVTQQWYAEQLASPEAMVARQFLTERGFDAEAAAHFGVGFSPRGGEALYRYLHQKRFTDEELVTSGLVGQGNRGHYDRFRGRLMWPIRDSSGDTIGFGARRIFDDDTIEAKYLNTPETPIYKKSQVLYGIDLARREIARASQAVIVEGYTDVMACHLAGVKTAVATCGTAFGDDHARVIRRLLQDHDEFRGEVIFTFDGDAAGQKAALRAFEGDQIFAGQTYVAVEPGGMDPCDLRLSTPELPTATPRCASWWPGGCRSTGSCWPTSSSATTSTAPTAASTRCARRPSWSPASATAPRSTPSPASWPGCSASSRSTSSARYAAPRRAAAGATAGPLCASGHGAARPARPAAVPRARDAQDRAPAPRRRRPHDGRRRSRGLHPRRLPGAVGEHPGRRRPGQRRRPLGRPAARRADRRAAAGAAQLAGGRAAAPRARRRLRPDARRPAARAHRQAPHRRPQVAAPAHQPGRARRPTTTGCSASSSPSRPTPAPCASARSRASSEGLRPARPLPADVLSRARPCRGASKRARLRRRPTAAPGCSAPGACSCCSCPTSGSCCRGRPSRTPPGTSDEERLRITGVGEYGRPQPSYTLTVPEPARLLQLIRERVTASIVLQRRVPGPRQARRSR